jgi:hypothetical protein
MRLLEEMGLKHHNPVIMFEDNTSNIAVTNKPVAHSKLKHLETIYRQVRDFISDGLVQVNHVETVNQLADVLTKILSPQDSITISASKLPASFHHMLILLPLRS